MKYGYTIGSSILALALAALPAAALAERGSASADAQAGIEVSGLDATASGTAQVSGDNQGGDMEASGESSASASSSEASQQQMEQAREQAKQQMEQNREAVKNAFELMKEGLPFSLDASTTAAFSLEQLKQSIELRKQELDQEEENASTSPDVAEAVKDANPVRLAVHALLASKPLLGGIGSQVSVIAQQMNDSLATTTSAELKIQSRGFLTRLFFGGDKASAEAISEAVAKNQERIQELTALMNQASTSADLKLTIQAQIDALQSAQAHLQDVANAEAKTWGLFSWRF